jgi:uncharacterized protein YbcI
LVAFRKTNIIGAYKLESIDYRGFLNLLLGEMGMATPKLVRETDTTSAFSYKKRLNDQQRRQIQHEIKLYMEQYFKDKLGKGVDYTKIVIWDDMLIIRGEGFLTTPEKYINETPSGSEVVRAARMQVVKQHAIDNVGYFEEKLQARAIHHAYGLEPENDFWMHVIVFDRVLTE